MPNLDHLGGINLLISLISPRMVKIQHFPPKWSRFRFLMVLIWIPFLISPPNGQDSAQICSNCQLQYLRLMALPVIEELSYLDAQAFVVVIYLTFKVCVKMKNLENGTEFIWTKEKFLNRLYLMKEMYSNYEEEEDDWDLPEVFT